MYKRQVAAAHVTSVKSISNIDNNTLNVTVGTSCDCNSGIVTVKLLDKGQVVASAKGVQGKELRLSVQNPTLWSPSNPYLYDMTVSLSKDGKVLDEVKSYKMCIRDSSDTIDLLPRDTAERVLRFREFV